MPKTMIRKLTAQPEPTLMPTINPTKVYTVKQLSSVACVTIRTLHYYDEIGLLKPAAYGDNGYRYYDEQAVLKLQQILFFRELDFSLEAIRDILDSPDFDTLQALETHRNALQQRLSRLNHLVHTVDQTIDHLKGKIEMSQEEMFEGFSEAQHKEYEKEVRERWSNSPDIDTSYKNWNSYSKAKKEQIIAEGHALHRDLGAAMEKGHESKEVQAIIARWHQQLRNFYEPSIERMRGLGELYNQDERFRRNYEKVRPGLAEFMRKAINVYCDELENHER